MSNDTKLWRKQYQGEWPNYTKNHNLYVWAAVYTATGEVEMELCDTEDEFEIDDGWEWKRFRLVEDSE